MAVGKITGQMLGNTSGNLERDGVDLVFDNDLIYLDVTNRKVGIKTTSPNHELTVNGTTRSTNLEATNSATLGNIVVTGDQIYSNTGVLNFNLTGGGQVVYQNRLQVDDIQIEGNRIATINSNADLELTANGTGTINLNSNVEVFGDLHATGTITADGNLQLGDANTDNITFNADIASNVTPDVTDTYKLGSSTKRWNDVWVNNLYAESVATGAIEVAGINIGLSQGNIYYVAVNGADDNGGTHQQDPLSSVGRALDLASAGDTVYIYPGTYSETLPLVVPAGVTVKGAGIRSVTIQPDSDVTVDMFHLNGETTIEDLTISGFEYDVGTNTGYAFRFASNMTVTTRSPYIRNVSVITTGSTVRLMTNPVDDPRGFLAGDAGKGAYLDGSVVNPASKEATMLFHSVTFICPGVDAITATNGVRIEWLNSFTYFADRSFYLTSGSTGFAGANGGDPKTRLKVYGISAATLAPGNTISVENVSVNPATVTTGTIESVTYDSPYTYIVLDGKITGWETSLAPPDTDNQQVITFSPGGQTASYLANVDYSDFGVELRSIASASVYGNYGAVGDGYGVIGYFISHNFGYVGVGRFSDNDATSVIQANEIVQTTSARLYYTSVDHKGDYRVGEYFYVNQDDGTITFNPSSLTITSPAGVTFTDGPNITIVDPTKIETGNIRISGNTIESTTGGVTLTAANSEITSTSNVTITGTLDVVQDVNFNGNTVIGDSSSDTVTFNSQVNSNVVPSTNTTYNLGSTSKQWQNVYLAEAIVDDISISGNVITTTVSNSNLELRANGTGAVRVDTLDFKSNVISSNTTNADININPNGTGKIQLLKDTDITGNLGVTGNITLGGNIQIGDNSSDTINLVGSITNNLIPSVTGNFNIGSNGLRWKNVYLSEAIVDDISVSGNLITTTVSNSNLELRANGTGAVRVDTLDFKSNIISSNSTNANININPNGTGKIQLLKDTDITGNLSVTGNITLGGNIQIGDNSSDTINLVGSITNNLIPSVTGNFDIGSNSLRWRNLYASNVTVNDIEINDNYIRTVSSNADLELRANGTGVVSIPSNNVTIDQNLTVTSGTTTLNNTVVNGTLTTDNLIVNAPVIASSFGTGDIIVQGNVIQTTLSNSNLELRANGSGSIVLESLSVSSSTISGTVAGQDIELTPSGTGIVKINGTQSLQLPAGTDGDRPAVPTSGMIRFNSTANRYEGYNGSYWLQLGGISDVDRNTYIIPESTPGANDNTLYFYANNQLAATLDSTKFAPNKILVDDLEINGNVIRTTTTNTDIELRPNGTGAVVVDGFRITANTITNANASVVTEFRSTGTGYYYIVGTNAVVIPSGGNGARPGAPQIGMIRFNTDLGLVEAWDGANWNSVAGATSGISSATANDIAATMALIFG
jgi:hypothetical protein